METTEAARLGEAKEGVKQHAFYMKRSLDARDLRVALQHAATMLGELRTSSLGPKSYYELYMAVTDQLRHLEDYFASEQKAGKRMQDIYELVQHAGNVLPRLYLLVAVGSVYIASQEAAAKDVLKDLVEMCRGVQQPMRGLFLRNYLSQTSKDKLPDVGSVYEGAGGTVSDAVSFILSNFGEMNKLWVRMQHQGPVRERERRERERSELRILVGTNLVRLSSLEGVTLEVYSETVLPTVLEQVVNCKDAISQQYLMDCITQVFPVEYHVATLPLFLKHCGWLSAAADVNQVLLTLMERLGAHAAADDESEEVSVVGHVAAHVAELMQKEGEDAPATEEMLLLYQGLVRLALRVYPQRLAYVDKAFEQCGQLLERVPGSQSSKRATLLSELSMLPLQHHADVLVPLQLASWPTLTAHLSHANQKKVVGVLVDKITEQESVVADVGTTNALLTFVAPLMRDAPGEVADDVELAIDEDLALELTPLSRVVHALHHDHTDDLGRILNTAYKHAAAGSARRSPFTLVPLVFECLKLARRIAVATAAEEQLEVSAHKLLSFVARMVEAVKPHAAALALRLFLQCAQTADACGEEADAYEFLTQAFVVYEEELPDSRAQSAAVTLIAATISSTSGFSSEHYETLAASATQKAAKLLKKTDQSRAVCLCSRLFWPLTGADENRNPKRVLECLQRALKIADACKVSNTHTPLFVEILEAYLWHFDQKNELVTTEYLTSLVQLIDQHLAEESRAGEVASEAHRTRYANVQRHIAAKVAEGAEGYAELALQESA
uniref:Vacuolar protein sorting-associated protein 35 n=1 Tax=Calcidiscus leptoporus TaxID=127549 RepID=A0A7S0JA92_9EUKA|mmetsp:Transcript_47733/g.110643  ORF Transcript_47733/g.110643 Transcript_47733/m.110643 type:complete len:783 (+) Transcript_47733:65-2413(+)